MRPRLSAFIFWVLVIAWAAQCYGCAGPRPPQRAALPHTGTIVWNKDYEGGAGWEKASEKRFHRTCVVFACHGAADDDGEWYCYPDGLPRVPVRAVARLLRAAYGPGVPILLIVCNDGGKGTIDVPNVWYARRRVWDIPGPAWRISTSGELRRDTGDVNDFIEGSK